MTSFEAGHQSDYILSLRNVNKHYGGVHALQDVDFDLSQGELHSLVGENGSGKSTLVKIITGVEQPDEGTKLFFQGKELFHVTPHAALLNGIHVVHQDLSLFPNLSVAENIASHKYAEHGFRLAAWKETRELADKVMKELDIHLDPERKVGELPVADQQLVAICRSIASEARILILDEPTAALTHIETQRLFDFLRMLTEKGVSVLFISHRLDEILEISQKITVLRNGKKVGSYPAEELDKNGIIRLMTGKDVVSRKPEDHTRADAPVLRVEGLTRRKQFEDVNFTLRSGEILGLIGPRGAGRTELALSLFGMNPPDAGKMYMEESPVRIRSNRDAIRLGIGYVPENRLKEGLILEQSIENNAVLTNLKKILGRLFFTDPRKKSEFAENIIKNFNVVTPGIKPKVRTLSGGNQQKLVLGKWVRTNPSCLILDTPTSGVDVGAKDGIRQIIEGLAKEGIAILLISDEESEILEHCPRTLLMRDGRVYGPYETAELSEEQLRSMIRQEQEAGL